MSEPVIYWQEQGAVVITHEDAAHEIEDNAFSSIIDQSAYMHLPTSELLAKRNAGQVFQMMEFE